MNMHLQTKRSKKKKYTTQRTCRDTYDDKMLDLFNDFVSIREMIEDEDGAYLQIKQKIMSGNENATKYPNTKL